MSIYQNLVLEIGRVFTGAPPWCEEYIIPIISIISICLLFFWIISLAFGFVKKIVRGK